MLKAKRRERTLAHAAEVRGHGFFHGSDVTLRFRPAEPGTGVVFERIDLPDRPSVPARIDRVVPSARRTTIRQGDATVEMTEHVMAALAGMHVDNCIVEIDAPECPGCDGSSRVFRRGVRTSRHRRTRPDARRSSCSKARWSSARETRLSWPTPARRRADPGLSSRLRSGCPDPRSQLIARECLRRRSSESIAPSRTFVTEKEANALRAAGIGLRTTAADLLIFGREGLIGNSLRYPRRMCAAQSARLARRPGSPGLRPRGADPRASLRSSDQPCPGAPADRPGLERTARADGRRRDPAERLSRYSGHHELACRIATRSCWSIVCSSSSPIAALWRSRT